MIHLLKYTDFLCESDQIDNLVKNARKWQEGDFVEEYVYLHDFNYAVGTDGRPVNRIKQGDKLRLGAIQRDSNGKPMYDKNGLQSVRVVGGVITAKKDYGSNIWEFIMDNTAEVQEEARKIYAANRNNKKPAFSKIPGKTVRAYHASPEVFDRFESKKSNSGQLGADLGFFFFLVRKNAEYYASTMDNGYIYEVDVKIGKQLVLNGEDVGTNWTRYSELAQADIEGYNTVLIKDADTGYGITDELVVFDDDNIKIIKVVKHD